MCCLPSNPWIAVGRFILTCRPAGFTPGRLVQAGPDPIVAVYVTFFPDVALLQKGHPIVQRHGGVVRDDVMGINTAVVEMPASRIMALADEDGVQWIEPPLPLFDELNDAAREATGADEVQAPPYSLDGTGVKVMVFDGGRAAIGHMDFGGRAVVGPSDSDGVSSHATHVACTVGGNGALSCGLYGGMAPNVDILTYGFQVSGAGTFLYTNPGDLESDYSEAISLGAVVANNSIGTNLCNNGYGNPEVFDCDFTGDYGVTSQLIDHIITGGLGERMRIMWSAGNERTCTRCVNIGGATSAGYHSTAPPSCAKNSVVVGALNSDSGTMTAFSSWGPCDDGRLKPDIVGPGCLVMSCDADGGYAGLCGTSMSTPVMTGLSALVLQDFALQFPEAPEPMNSTIKALLLHNAEDWGTVGPDYKSGYGSVRIKETIDFLRSGQFFEHDVSQDDHYAFEVDVTQGQKLKITLVWDDAPGTPNVGEALVNDLDLIVHSPTGTRIYPYTLNPEQHSQAAKKTVEDHLNNVEQVVVNAATPGTWRVEIVGFEVPEGPQPFSVCVEPAPSNCVNRGRVDFDRLELACVDTALIEVVDCGLNVDPEAIDSAVVRVYSESDATGVDVELTESAPELGIFQGTVAVGPTPGDGVVGVSSGDSLTVVYTDADDGAGHVDIEIENAALVDCIAPQLASVRVIDIAGTAAEIAVMTNEPTEVRVAHGASCGTLEFEAVSVGPATTHTVMLADVVDGGSFAVEIRDVAGNILFDDQGGACFDLVEEDCNDNGVPDNDELVGGALDCNTNGVPDDCDIAFGSLDCQADGIPDECQFDCDSNGVADDCDITAGAADCNANAVPDACEVAIESLVFDQQLTVPLSLPEGGFAIDSMTIEADGLVQEVALRLDISHGNASDLRIRLQHGTTVIVVDGCPAAGEDFIGTVLRDDAETPICEGAPPYTGTFVPQNPLSALKGTTISGTWTLLVSSTNQGGCGVLNGWSLILPVAEIDCNRNAIPDECDIADGDSLDDDRNGIPDECEVGCVVLGNSVPPTEAIDARQPHAADDADLHFGWETVDLAYSGPVERLTVDDFTVQLEGAGETPTVIELEILDDENVRVHLDQPIAPGAWTTVTYNCLGSSVRMGYLPGDVNGDGISNPNDILAIIDTLNGVIDLPGYATDINRSGSSEPLDILTLIDLLNGAGAFAEWNGQTLP